MPEQTKGAVPAGGTTPSPAAADAQPAAAAATDAPVAPPAAPAEPGTVYVAKRGFLARFKTQLLRFLEGDEIEERIAKVLRSKGCPIKTVQAEPETGQ